MKSRTLLTLTATALFATLAIPVQLAAQEQEQKKEHVRYTVTDLGPTQSFAEGINNRSLVAGTAILADGVTQHAFLSRKGIETDLGTFGGPNSSAFFKPSERGQVAGNAETSTPDPLGEDFCTYGTHLVCLAFVWQDGVMTPLGTLGGNNSWATGGVNNRGQVGGNAENTTLDPTCANPAYEAKPAIWEKGTVRELPTLPGDRDGSVAQINDHGQAVGGTTDCVASPTIVHAVLWREGAAIDLGGFGGALNNSANGINNRGQIVGVSDLPGDTSFHAFLWENNVMTDLGTMYGLPSSWAFGINDEGQVVGMICAVGFDCGAFLWQEGVMTDLNTLLPNNTPWNLIVATNVNDHGEIVATAENNGFRTVLLTPCDENHPGVKGCDDSSAPVVPSAAPVRRRVVLSENVRQLLQQRSGFGRFIHTPEVALGRTAAPSAPNATLSPTSLTFSTQAVGTTSAAKTVTLKNTGTTSLTITAIAIAGTNAGDFAQTHTCGNSLAAGANCSLSLTFKPTASGTRAAALSISDNAPGSPQKVTLSGFGTTAKLSPTSLSFGTVAIDGTISPTKTVTLTNLGTTTLSISGIAITGTNAGDFAQTHTCGNSLAAGASCSINIRFTPTASGIRIAALSISDNSAGSPQKVALSGTGVNGGTLDGYCLQPSLRGCSANYDPTECPPGAAAIDPGDAGCGFPPNTADVDFARRCYIGYCSTH